MSEPVGTGATSYGWHGVDERAVDGSGLILMGARLYNPVTGLFLSRDPVEGGNTTSYAYPQDPVGMNDITGLWSWKKAWGTAKRVWRNPWFQVGLGIGLALVPGGLAIRAGVGIVSRISGIYRAANVARTATRVRSVNGFTRHGLNQIVSRGVPPRIIRNTINHPVALKPQYHATLYFGRKGNVVLNKSRNVVTAYRSSKIWKKMQKIGRR